jgi:hypothetical protein
VPVFLTTDEELLATAGMDALVSGARQNPLSVCPPQRTQQALLALDILALFVIGTSGARCDLFGASMSIVGASKQRGSRVRAISDAS